MEQHTFKGKILIIGFGSIGQGVLPLLLKHFTITPERMTIVTADSAGAKIAKKYGVKYVVEPVTRDNYVELIKRYIGKGDFLLNVSVGVSTADLVTHCQQEGILYLDTVIEPWAGYYTDPSLSMSERSNYALREQALELRNLPIEGPRPTAVLAHGANPGLVSHFVKEGLLRIAEDIGKKNGVPKTKDEWAKLAQSLKVRVIHIAERDTQVPKTPKKMDEFVNTWSVDGFYSEGCQPSEMGWGTHEKSLPKKGRKHDFGCDAAIYLAQPGINTKVRSWTPISGPQQGWVITHNESISIADYLTVKRKKHILYRPTVHYAYHPCDGAVLSLIEVSEREGEVQKNWRLITDEIVSGGTDELGVLLMGHKKNALWYGSRLTIDEARQLVPHNNATSLQVVAGIIGAMAWALKNPTSGILEAEELDHTYVLKVARPYLGEMLAVYTDWNPNKGRGTLFPEQVDADPWQFENFLVK